MFKIKHIVFLYSGSAWVKQLLCWALRIMLSAWSWGPSLDKHYTLYENKTSASVHLEEHFGLLQICSKRIAIRWVSSEIFRWPPPILTLRTRLKWFLKLNIFLCVAYPWSRGFKFRQFSSNLAVIYFCNSVDRFIYSLYREVPLNVWFLRPRGLNLKIISFSPINIDAEYTFLRK